SGFDSTITADSSAVGPLLPKRLVDGTVGSEVPALFVDAAPNKPVEGVVVVLDVTAEPNKAPAAAVGAPNSDLVAIGLFAARLLGCPNANTGWGGGGVAPALTRLLPKFGTEELCADEAVLKCKVVVLAIACVLLSVVAWSSYDGLQLAPVTTRHSLSIPSLYDRDVSTYHNLGLTFSR
ncbi:unnamed protein product, partial [Rhizoctonia solani]